MRLSNCAIIRPEVLVAGRRRAGHRQSDAAEQVRGLYPLSARKENQLGYSILQELKVGFNGHAKCDRLLWPTWE